MDFSEIIFAIVLGLFAGAIGKLLMPGDDPGGVVATILLGLPARSSASCCSRRCSESVTRTRSTGAA